MLRDLDIVIHVGGLPVDPRNWRDRGLGGSETAALSMAHALATLGHHVIVFCNTGRRQEEDRVVFLPLADFTAYAASVPTDVLVVQRDPAVLNQRTNARLNVLWQHDQPSSRIAAAFVGSMWNVDKCLILSAYQNKSYEEMFGTYDGFFHQTRNGIDGHLFKDLDHVVRSSNELIYGARPERGLSVLLQKVMPRIWSKRPDVILNLCTYDCPHPELVQYYADLDKLIDSMNVDSQRVRRLGSLGKRALAEAYARAAVYVYPTPPEEAREFAEVSCISAMECMAAGLPIVASSRGALPETVATGAGILVGGDPWTDVYQEEFSRTVLQLLDDDDRRARIGKAGRAHAQHLDWSTVAKEWTEDFWNWIDERNNRPSRLARHLIWNSDIVAARHVVSTMPEGTERSEFHELLDDGPWKFVASDKYNEQYEERAEEPRGFDFIPKEERFAWLLKEVGSRPNLRRILDVGCAFGGYQIQANNELLKAGLSPRDWVGLDVNASTLRLASELARTESKCPERHRFLLDQGERTLVEELPFDALVAFEVLEHVAEPWNFLKRLERSLSPESEVFITVPSGPWEAISYESSPDRFHVWHFDLHDLRDMLGHKPGFVAWFSSAGTSPRDQAPIGWWFVRYRVGAEEPRPIDLDRHARLQRPRETLSATLMAGPGAEETLHWCLRPVAAIADEIVLVDNGMSDEAKRIAEQYPVRIVAGANPLTEGFETPRNIGLREAKMDWVLWVDTDERILDPERLLYALRRNVFDGYALTQCNLNCDQRGKNETPVRLFRNNGWRNDKKAIQFWGAIHEQPGTDLNSGAGLVTGIDDVSIAHLGYLSNTIRLSRFHRNAQVLRLDQRRYPDRKLGPILQIRENMDLCSILMATEAEHARNAASVQDVCRKTVTLYREHLLGEKSPWAHMTDLAREVLGHYSRALEILGEGFEFSWSGGPNSDRSGRAQSYKGRFATMDEVEKTVTASIGEIILVAAKVGEVNDVHHP